MKALVLIGIIAVTIVDAEATGWFGPMVYLDQGGRNVDASPEFYWDLELKRMARDFNAPEKLFQRPLKSADPRPALLELTANADQGDFEDALKTGRIRPTDSEQARRAHEAARKIIQSANAQSILSLPQEFPSEFSDYHRGAFAYRRGPEHFSEARDAWMALLNRPPEERHYRTVWAAFMLGKLALKTGAPEAQKWFQQTRELTRQGFADSLGLAADSYGWEGRVEWKQDHPAEAAKLFLTQLSLGDESAVVSLKALIPDRQPVGGMLNYNVVESDTEHDQWEPKKKLSEEQELAALQRAAEDPLLRRLVTAHILATGSTGTYFSEEGDSAQARARRWLQVIKAAKLERVEDAEYVGWIAYMRGDYTDAAHWLKLSGGTTPAALWLKAKLERRDGQLGEAVKAMADAWKILRDTRAYTGWAGPLQVSDYDSESGRFSWSLSQEARGDFAALHLQRADFVQALDIFFKGNLWDDAAYVAESVLTINELKRYVDQLPAPPASPTPITARTYGWQDKLSATEKLRYLLGRRLVREHRYEEAMRYLQPPFDQILRHYVEALHAGANQGLPKTERAFALFRAAWIARYDGMEIMGTEMAPDGFTEDGQFPVPDIGAQRTTGKVEEVTYAGTKTVSAPLKATREEQKRVARSKASPDIRFHYRLIAGALAIRAAALLPNNSEETADVINMAGRWTKEQDEKAADKYFDLLEERAGETEIGRAATARRWFVDMNGPWSTKLELEEKQMKRELGLDDPYEQQLAPPQNPSPTPSTG